MQGFKKCFGASVLLFITLFLSFINFSDANALLHDVKYIPLTTDGVFSNSLTGSPYNSQFSISWNSAYYPSSAPFKTNYNHFFSSEVLNNKCTFVNFSSRYSSTPNLESYNFYFGGIPSYRFNYRSNDDSYLCFQNTAFGSIYSNQSNILSHPHFDDSSLVNIPVADRFPYLDLPPFYYDYDSAYIHDSATSTSTGVTYNNTLKMSDIVGFAPNRFSDLTIPLGRLNEDVVGPVTQGRHIKYHGVFDFSGEGKYVEFNDFNIYLYWAGLTEQQSSFGENYAGTVTCSSVNVTLPALNFNQLEFDCEFDSPYTFYNGQLWFNLRFQAAQNADFIFNTNANWSFASAYFMTDNDSTPGGTWGSEPTGNHLDDAPGSAESIMPPEDDFSSDLSNLFNFSFINPFAPIFSIFTDNSQCANIPIISGMLGIEEISYCPWFSNSTRAILTPVISFASVMLLFGFLVRWLGASSGNLFDDSSDNSVTYVSGSGLKRIHKGGIH